jgi:3-oxoacyl-[acyl-carrier protein] reductase
MDLGLKNKVVMAAAASRGLGYHTARTAAQEGARLSIGSRSEEHIASAAETLKRETGSQVKGFSLDMKDGQSISRWVESTVEIYGTIDAVLVNAGGPPAGIFADFDDTAWEEAFRLTLLSAVRLIRETAEVMKKNGGGSILTITSISVKEPIQDLILSNVMRSGVVSLVKSLSREFAPHGIRVNNIIPGFFNTDRLKNLDAAAAEQSGQDVEEVRKKRQANVPLRRYGEPEEFGKAAVFLLSPAAAYVSGHSFVIDGGLLHSLM